jgi:predicted ATP-grasp superfamily ATP-dependent carboligase
MRTSSERVNVLALGSGISLLGALRTLSRLNVNAIALPDVDRVTRRSRWYKAAPSSLVALTSASLEARLSELPIGTVLIPCSDSWARAIAALPADTLRRYPASIAPLAALDTLVDKSEFRATLNRLGLPHPQTITVNSVEDLKPIPDRLLGSSFLKPAHSQQFFAKFGVKAFRISGRSDAEARLRQCTEAGLQMMLQEYIPGPPTNHYFIDGFMDRGGVVRALFARRRLRMSPPDFGNSTMQVSVPLTETGDAVNTMEKLLADISYRGIFSAEFKRDERDGVFNLIEVNARAWWYVEFAARCGVNVCALAVRDALGQPVESIRDYAIGRRCVFPYYDIQAVRAERAAGRLGLVDWAASWIGPYQPIFRWSDPIPATLEVAVLLAGKIRRGAKKSRA